MERSVRSSVVRYVERRKGLAALLFLGAVPWVGIAWLGREPAFHAVAGLFLLAAYGAMLPARTLAVDRAAGTLTIVSRALSGRVVRQNAPLEELRGVRLASESRASLVWIDFSDGRSTLAARRWDVRDARRLAERLAEDLGRPLRA